MPQINWTRAMERVRIAMAKAMWKIGTGKDIGWSQNVRVLVPAVNDLERLYVAVNKDMPLYEVFNETDLGMTPEGFDRFGELLVRWATNVWDGIGVREARRLQAPKSITVPSFSIELVNNELEWSGEGIEDLAPNPEIPSEADYLGETLGAPTLNPDKLSCPCGGTMVPKGTETIAGQKRYVAECPQCGDARYSLKPYRPRGLGKPPWLSPNPRGRLAPGVAAHERRARKVGSLACPCGAQMVDTGETSKLKGDVKRYIAECPNCGDARYSMAPYPKE